MRAALLAGVITLCALPASADRYSYYGGTIDTQEKNAAIEACEYTELVEKQRCNGRMNKSDCIKEIHRECRERFSDPAADPADPPSDPRSQR